jgi:hypothetical protein
MAIVTAPELALKRADGVVVCGVITASPRLPQRDLGFVQLRIAEEVHREFIEFSSTA